MLQAIRERAQGWIAWVIVGLISIPFALWGIQQYLGGGGETVVAKIGGYDLTERELDIRYQQFRQNLRDQLGEAYRPDLFDDKRMRADVLEDLIDNTLVSQEASRLGLTAGDSMVRQTILSIPAFQKDGRFDPAAYERAVRLQGKQPAMFEQQLRQSLISNQLSLAVSSSAFTTRKELEASVRLRKQKRAVSYFEIDAAELAKISDVSEADIKARYDSAQDRFMSPEQVKVAYLELSPDKLAKTIQPSEDGLKAWYQAHVEDFVEAEQRRASHILLSVAADAAPDEVAKVKGAIEALKQRVDAGEDFAALAKSSSQDSGSGAQGGDLGFFGAGLMDPAFEQAAFAQEKGVVGDPVRSQFGYHLIKVTDIKPRSEMPFEKAKDKVRERYTKAEVEKQFYDYAERLTDLVYEDPNSLDPAAAALGLTVETSNWIGREGGEGALASPKVGAAAFSTEVLEDKHNSELIDLGEEHVVVLRVVDHREANLKPLEQVRDSIVAEIRSERGRELALAQGKAAVEAVKAGKALEEVASGKKVKKSEAFLRDSSATDVPVALVAEAFRLPRPADGAASVGMAELGSGNVAVLTLNTVADGKLDDLDEGARKQEQESLARTRSRGYFEHMVRDLRNRGDVEIMTQAQGATPGE